MIFECREFGEIFCTVHILDYLPAELPINKGLRSDSRLDL
jgi:hypothetical protein